MLPLLFQERGARMTADFAIRVLMGRGVGGSTIHNTNLCKRTPPQILDLWARKYGVVGCSEAELLPDLRRDRARSVGHRDRRSLCATGTTRFSRAAMKALGFHGGPLKHNRVGCRESGFCELGCAYDAKQNVTKVLLPDAFSRSRAGGGHERRSRDQASSTAAARCRASPASPTDAAGKPVAQVALRAKVVVLAASAVGSAALALASGVPDPQWAHRTRAFGCTPAPRWRGSSIERIDGVYGIPQSYECTEFLDFGEESDRRVWITTAFAHPIGAAASMPGFGAPHMASHAALFAHGGAHRDGPRRDRRTRRPWATTAHRGSATRSATPTERSSCSASAEPRRSLRGGRTRGGARLDTCRCDSPGRIDVDQITARPRRSAPIAAALGAPDGNHAAGRGSQDERGEEHRRAPRRARVCSCSTGRSSRPASACPRKSRFTLSPATSPATPSSARDRATAGAPFGA